MRFKLLAACAALAVVIPVSVGAQDFGVMNSAETINRGNFKLMANPMFIFVEDADTEVGVALAGGYGFTDSFDVEARAAFYDGLQFFGADAEFWVVKGRQVDVSVIGGFNVGRRDDFNVPAFDFTLLGSGHVADRLELYGGLDFSKKLDDFVDYTSVHLVPGIEYAINPDLDLNSEFGIALNDNSQNYFSIGIAYYLR